MKKGILAAILLTLTALSVTLIFTRDRENGCQSVRNCQNGKTIFSGTAATQTRELQPFDKLHASAGIEVYLIKSDSLFAEVTADEKIIDRVKTEVSNGKLRITYKTAIDLPFLKKNFVKTVVRVYTPDINNLNISVDSGADIKLGAGLGGESITIEATSAAEVEGSINYNKVDISATSGSDVDLEGKCDTCRIDVTSGADVNTENLECVNITVSATSGSDATVWATGSINATSTSGADIKYYGNPTTNINKSSGGSVRQADNR